MTLQKLYILLSRSSSITSKIVYFFTKTTYTHSSLAFDEELNQLYSSARKKGTRTFPAGPTRESLYKGFFGRDNHIPCAIYSLEVSDEVYNRAKAQIDFFMEHIDDYKFSAWGIIACKFGIKWERKNKYFCSQFLAEILTKSGALSFDKPNCLVHPRDYQTVPGIKLIFEGTIGEVKERVQKKEAVTL